MFANVAQEESLMRKTVLYSGIIFTLVAIRAAAWEKDLHYGLTKWLAYQAGFSLDDAETIAKGAEAPDEGKLYPAPEPCGTLLVLAGTRMSQRSCSSSIFLATARCLGHPSTDLSIPLELRPTRTRPLI
jgi:hypothetical protein